MIRAEPTLLDRINIVQAEIRDYKASIDRAEANLHPLKALRQFCQHDYEPAPPNYVHEGGVCRLCGGNELAMISRNYF